MQHSPAHRLADLLLALEAEMRRIGLWESAAPPAAALRSTAPFCYDTLAFEQWLQWVLLPRMKELLENDGYWPARCDIFPLAEQAFAEQETDTDVLLLLIRRLDELISDAAG
jgi:uncharacterized protein YqcC (DUF446 family)